MKTEITFAVPSHSDLIDLATRLKPDDVNELLASSGRTPDQTFAEMIKRKIPMTGAYEGDLLIAIFGVNPEGYEKGTAAVWMLTSDDIYRHGKSMVKLCRKWLAMQQKRHGILFNMVDARATRTLAWLSRLGFKFTDMPAYGVHGLPFVMVTLGD